MPSSRWISGTPAQRGFMTKPFFLSHPLSRMYWPPRPNSPSSGRAISVGLMTPEAGLRANQAGVPIRLVQPYQSSHMYVLVRKDLPYNAVEDLKSKPVALTSEVTTLYHLF